VPLPGPAFYAGEWQKLLVHPNSLILGAFALAAHDPGGGSVASASVAGEGGALALGSASILTGTFAADVAQFHVGPVKGFQGIGHFVISPCPFCG
jgi:hypothetical protein